MAVIVVDAVGEACPIPVVKATRALRGMTSPGTLEVRVDNEVAVQNLKRMAAGHHLPFQAQQLGQALFTVTMEVAQPLGDAPVREVEMTCTAETSGGFLAAVDTDVMGRGSEALGRTLMKGFLYALGQLPRLPETILFYNGGAHLTTEGSASLEDLRGMEARGVEILTCGTCLEHYGLTEKLAVGSVTNMYTIVEKLAAAGKVIKP
ncbi:sulfurtransferase-like selenium metabolism protein YedF [Dysosmobacter sp.]